MRDGKLDRGQIQAWALNRYYYQARIPAKDAYLVARLPTPALRREWRRRILDHDGDDEETGGIARWLRLTDGLGLDRDYVISTAGLLAGTRFAVDAYVDFVRDRPLLEAVASCLTEMFSPQIIAERVSGMLAELRFRQPRHARLFHPAADPGADRRRLCPRLRQGARRHAGKAGARCSTPYASNATCCGRSSTRSISPMSSLG